MARSLRIIAVAAYHWMCVGFSNLAGAGSTRRWGLDRAGTRKFRLAPLWRLARSLDQSARATLRYGLACANDRVDTKSGADAGRYLFGNHRGGPPTIKTCPRLQSLWEVFGRYCEPYSEYPVLPCSSGHSHPTGATWLNATPGRWALSGVKRYSTVASVELYSEDTSNVGYR
jgi:hypothetical protein